MLFCFFKANIKHTDKNKNKLKKSINRTIQSKIISMKIYATEKRHSVLLSLVRSHEKGKENWEFILNDNVTASSSLVPEDLNSVMALNN